MSDTTRRARQEAREATEWFLDNFAMMFTLPEGEAWPESYKFFEPWAHDIRSLSYDKVIEDDLVRRSGSRSTANPLAAGRVWGEHWAALYALWRT